MFYNIRKKNVFVFMSVALDFTFILVSELQLNCYKKRKWCYNYFGIRAQVVFVLVFEYILKVKVLVVQWMLQGQSPKVGWSSEAWSKDCTKTTTQSLSF